MRTTGTLPLRRGLSLIAIVGLAVACADGTTRMTSLPNQSGAQQDANIGTVVLLRVAGESDGKALTLSTLPRWKSHLLINIGPVGHPLEAGQSFGAGQLDSVSKDAGWG